MFFFRPGLQDPNLIATNQREEIRSKLVNQINDSLEICKKLINLSSLTVPTIDSFIHIDEEATDVKTKWLSGTEVKTEEFKCQASVTLINIIIIIIKNYNFRGIIKTILLFFRFTTSWVVLVFLKKITALPKIIFTNVRNFMKN